MTTSKKPKAKEPIRENVEFGATLLSARQSCGLTLDELSRLTKLLDQSGDGISRVTLSRYENGTYAPGLRELKLLSHAVRLPLSVLVYQNPDDPMNFLDVRIEDIVERIVLEVLEGRGLVKKSEHIRRSDAWTKLVEKARKGA